MKIRKILAGVLAGTMAIGMMAMNALAGFVTTVDYSSVDAEGAFSYNLVEAGLSADEINGATVTIDFTVDDSDGFGGGIMMNASSGWKQSEAMYWGNEKQANNAVKNDDGSYSLTVTLPEEYAVTDEDLSGEEKTWCSLCLQQWWGNEITVTGVQVDKEVNDEEEPKEPAGVAYIAFGADTTYTEPAEVSAADKGTITFDSWKWGDASETWGNYDVQNPIEFTSLDALLSKNIEGKTPSSISFYSEGKFGVGYNGAEGWEQNDAEQDAESGLYALDVEISKFTTDAENFYAKIYDAAWGWVPKETTGVDVMWALNYGENTINGSWNTYYYSADQVTADVTQVEVPFTYGEELVLEANLATPLDYAWFVAPTFVFDEELPTVGADEDLTAAGFKVVSVQLFVNGEEVAVELPEGAKQIWAEGTGSNDAANTARVCGGYNEWGTAYVPAETFVGATNIKYVITIDYEDVDDGDDGADDGDDGADDGDDGADDGNDGNDGDGADDEGNADDAIDNKTGDASFLWIAVAVLAATAAGTTVVISKRRAEEM